MFSLRMVDAHGDDKKVKRDDLQVLRALSVFAVVAYHYFPKTIPKGYLGVDTFFVISGFVVTPLVFRIFTPETRGSKAQNLRDFYFARFLRLIPALFSTVSITIIVSTLILSTNSLFNLARQSLCSILGLANFGAYKYVGNYFSPTINPFLHIWSLSVEQQIYIVLPVIFFILVKPSSKFQTRFIQIFVILTLVSFCLWIFSDDLFIKLGITNPNQLSYYMSWNRFWEFGCGGISWFLTTIAGLKPNAYFRKFRLLLISIFLLTIINPAVFRLDHKAEYILLVVLASILITQESFHIKNMHLNRALVWMGDRSYSIYLIHFPIIIFLEENYFRNSKKISISWSLGSIILTLFLANVQYTYVEKIFRNRSKFRNGNSRTLLALLIFTLAITGSANTALIHIVSHREVVKQPISAFDLKLDCDKNSGSFEPCIHNMNASKSFIILLGDSHAGMFASSFLHAAKATKTNAAVSTMSSCPYLVISTQSDLTTKCRVHNRNSLHWLRINRPSAIFISQYLLNSYSINDIKSSFEQISKFNVPIVFITQTPVFPDSRYFYQAPPLAIRNVSYKKEFRIEDMDSENLARAIQTEKIAYSMGFRVIKTSNLFCNSSKCLRFKNRDWLYFDYNHLSLRGARLIEPSIIAQMRKIRN